MCCTSAPGRRSSMKAMRAFASILALGMPALLAGLPACSTEQLYLTTQQWQKQECGRIQDHEQRMRCEKDASLSYERYKAEAEKARR